MTDARTLRELARVQHIIRLGVELAEAQQRNLELEEALAFMWHANIPLVRIADGARQSWPHINPDGSDTIGGAK